MARTPRFDAAEYLDSSQAVAGYLSEALETRDDELVAKAIGAVARAQDKQCDLIQRFDLPADRRAKIQARTRQLIAEEYLRRARQFTQQNEVVLRDLTQRLEAAHTIMSAQNRMLARAHAALQFAFEQMTMTSNVMSLKQLSDVLAELEGRKFP
jgi:hypothetical protein